MRSEYVGFRGEVFQARMLMAIGSCMGTTIVFRSAVLSDGTDKVLLSKPPLNPFTAPASKISGLKSTHIRLQTIFSGLIRNPLSALCALVEIPSHTDGGKKGLRIFQISHFY